jgi:hypothetical protein
MDQQVQEILDQLHADGLNKDTIVFFYSDNGDGLPRGKRWLYGTGIHVPLIVYFPDKYRHLADGRPESANDRLLSFVDFAPTVMSLAGLAPPSYMHGMAFLGRHADKERREVVAICDRVDEVLEFNRTILDGHYQYIRNFFPHRPRMQRSFYSEITPIRQEIRRLNAAGVLQGEAAWLMQPRKPVEELYDLASDPFRMHNLADDPLQQKRLDTMRNKLFKWMVTTRDLSLLHENDMIARAHGRCPYDAAGEDEYPFAELLSMADRIGRGKGHLEALRTGLTHADPGIRYWAATGLVALQEGAMPAKTDLLQHAHDPASWVRFTVAEALCHLGNADLAIPVLAEGLSHEDVRVALHAAQILLTVADKAQPALPAVKAAIRRTEGLQDHGWYLREALSWLAAQWNAI